MLRRGRRKRGRVVWAGTLALAAALAVLGFVSTGVTWGADSPSRNPSGAKTAPSPVQIRALRAQLQKALRQELRAIGYVKFYFNLKDVRVALFWLAQSYDALGQANDTAEDLHLRELARGDVFDARRHDDSAISILNKALNPREREALPRGWPNTVRERIHQAIKEKQSAIATLDKLLKPATPKPKPTTPLAPADPCEVGIGSTPDDGIFDFELLCGFDRNSNNPSNLIAKVVVQYPTPPLTTTFVVPAARPRPCAAAGATVTCVLSPPRVTLRISSTWPTNDRERILHELSTPRTVTATMLQGRTVSWRCVLEPGSGVVCRLLS